ncbi:STAS domain-containing protein [Mycolicibacterium sp.]|uniref:STAS domain-containing protein n=1 Tax=Mycolicibacterium sp. TaxID=2320850 RepID=UPI003D0DD178
MQQFTDRAVDDVVVVAAEGAVDMLTAPQFHQVVAAALARRPRGVIVDLTDVEFLASAGMQVLIITHDQAGADTRFAVVADGPATSRPLKITGIADVIDVFPTLEVALAEFGEVERPPVPHGAGA